MTQEAPTAAAVHTNHDTSQVRLEETIKHRQGLNVFASPRTSRKEISSMKPEKPLRKLMCHTACSSILSAPGAEPIAWRPTKRQFAKESEPRIIFFSLGQPTDSEETTCSSRRRLRKPAPADSLLRMKSLPRKWVDENGVNPTVSHASFGFHPSSRRAHSTNEESVSGYVGAAGLASRYPDHVSDPQSQLVAFQRMGGTVMTAKRHSASIRGEEVKEGQEVRSLITPGNSLSCERKRRFDRRLSENIHLRSKAPFPTNTPRPPKEIPTAPRSPAPFALHNCTRLLSIREPKRLLSSELDTKYKRTDTAWKEQLQVAKGSTWKDPQPVMCNNKRYALAHASERKTRNQF